MKAKHQSKAMPKDVPPVDPEKRKKLVSGQISDTLILTKYYDMVSNLLHMYPTSGNARFP